MITHISFTTVLLNALSSACNNRLSGNIYHVLLQRNSLKLRTSAKNISFRADWLHDSRRAPSELSETPRWWIAPRPASIQCVTLHIALRSPFHRFFSLCQSAILNKRSGIVANCGHTSEWFIGYTLASGLQCNVWRCKNLSSCSVYNKLEECRKKVKRYDTTRPWGSIKSRTERVRPKVGKDRVWIFIVW